MSCETTVECLSHPPWSTSLPPRHLSLPCLASGRWPPHLHGAAVSLSPIAAGLAEPLGWAQLRSRIILRQRDNRIVNGTRVDRTQFSEYPTVLGGTIHVLW